MSSNVPVIRKISWLAFFFQLLLLSVLSYTYYLLKITEPFIWAAVTYSLLAFALRNLIAVNHRHALKLVREKKFVEAIPFFEKSFNFFTENSWIDKYRFLTLLSSSGMCYREMALCNIAFSYSQENNGLKAIEYYTKVINEYPNNGMAQAGLKMLNSISNT